MKEISVKLNNEYVTVNPRTWRHRTDVTVNVGLGTGDRDVQLSRLQMIYAEQKEGFQQGIVPYEKLHHTLGVMLELSGFKDVQNYFTAPEDVQQAMAQQAQNQQPDPAQMLVEVEMAKVQAKSQMDSAKLQLDAVKLESQRAEMLLKKAQDKY